MEEKELDKPQLIPGQLSFFPAGKISSFLNEKEKLNISFSFEEIIYKNPAFTVGELEYLASEAEEMDDE
jgi:hypothetical protein